MAKTAGIGVCGSDKNEGAVTGELVAAGIEMEYGAQDGKFLKQKYDQNEVDWFVYTSALPAEHPELKLAKKLGLRISKRDELIAYLVDILDLKMVAVAGTHGKTTTTAMIIWTALSLGMPISYLVGSTLPFAESGKYDPESKFLVYEADEYDRNFLHFFPWLSVITTVSYDHPDIYKTKLDYLRAFAKFEGQSENVIRGRELEGKSVVEGAGENIDFADKFTLAGAARRYDAGLSMQAIFEMVEELDMVEAKESLIEAGAAESGFGVGEKMGAADGLVEARAKSYAGRKIDEKLVVEILNDFPGAGRRFEIIHDMIYSDYGHHPEEIAATVEMALEEAKKKQAKGVVVVYEPHQNVRQYEVFEGYKDAFSGVDKLFWLPTYLVREDPTLKVLTPEDFIESLSNKESGVAAEVGPMLAKELQQLRDEGYLILLMTAGPADKWLREEVFND